jgi:hypothetical protein
MVAISIILENSSPFDTSADDVMNGARGVYACLSRHAEKLAHRKRTWQDTPEITLLSTVITATSESYACSHGRPPSCRVNGARGVYVCLSRHAEKLATGTHPARHTRNYPFIYCNYSYL